MESLSFILSIRILQSTSGVHVYEQHDGLRPIGTKRITAGANLMMNAGSHCHG